MTMIEKQRPKIELNAVEEAVRVFQYSPWSCESFAELLELDIRNVRPKVVDKIRRIHDEARKRMRLPHIEGCPH